MGGACDCENERLPNQQFEDAISPIWKPSGIYRGNSLSPQMSFNTISEFYEEERQTPSYWSS